MDKQIEVRNEHRQQQLKLRYYIIALCVTSIGFSIFSTQGDKLGYFQIPLAIAVSSWALSIFLGIRFLKTSLNILNADNAQFDILAGVHKDVGNNPNLIEAALKGIKGAIDEHQNRGIKDAIWQERLFYIGILMFIIWHILEMYVKT